MLALIVVIVLASSIWAAADAAQRDWSASEGPFGLPMGWPIVLVACLLLWIVAFPFYLVERRHSPPREP